ncbi:NigD1/NigD2 family lipoprotein [Gabonibacter chumensis]|uniref:NigD-like protein n=1 Tax=Gabonibacter chumensis TaxID=2972474 RepID=UPI0025728688|nr:NigD-like protein [Gabonibacter chumensis]MCR9011605.1 NigD-like protein [Gabonibacter chumensis]
MKIERILRLTVLFIIAVLVVASCDDDGYSLSKFWVSYGVIHKSTEDNYTVKLDNGSVIYPSYSDVPTKNLQDSTRLLVDYTILQDATPGSKFDYYVRINGIEQILTKNILPYSEEILDSLGNDPVIVNDYWIAQDFLTIEFFFAGGLVQHMINLTRHQGLTEDGKVLLEFHHNANNDPDRYKLNSAVAFPLNKIFNETDDSVQLRVRYKGFDREEHFDITYRPRK